MADALVEAGAEARRELMGASPFDWRNDGERPVADLYSPEVQLGFP